MTYLSPSVKIISLESEALMLASSVAANANYFGTPETPETANKYTESTGSWD